MRQISRLTLIVLLLTGCGRSYAKPTATPFVSLVPAPTPANIEIRKGQVVTVRQPYGTYLQYIPTTLSSSPEIVVIVHGTPGKHETALEVANFYIQRWIAVAEQRGAIVIAPAFDQENFGSREGPVGGYRGLFGREIGADEFVIQIVDQYHALFNSSDRRFLLYGHSAGGQFVSRFLVRHPERIKRAVISAAATYAFPDPSVQWPYGMGRLQTTIRWHESDPEVNIDISPDPSDWVAAATLPVTVVVGLNDTEPQPQRPGQKGTSRVEIAWHWVDDMKALAAQNGKIGNIELSVVPGIGHGSAKLQPYCQSELFP